jgi:hypothetical protein
LTGYDSLCVDASPVDLELQDDGTTGPELAHLARGYRESPRALVFRNPSSDWRLFVVTLPLASRLSLMANPIFGQLTRSWGLNVRFVGVDRERLFHDFRALLSDRTLTLLVELLAQRESAGAAPRTLDVLFAALAREMLTVLERRRADWSRHLAREHRLEPGVPGTLFDHAGRYPDFLAGLRTALRSGVIDVAFYGRALRSIDLREGAVDARISALIESELDPVTVAKLQRGRAGKHLGAYNWLRVEPARAGPRAYLLTRLPAFATFFAESLLPIDGLAQAQQREESRAGEWEETDWADEAAVESEPGASGAAEGSSTGNGRRNGRSPISPGLDLPRLAARNHSAHSLHWAQVLRRAIDAGQDRLAIEAIAQRFAVGDNVIRRIWREQPAALGQPPTWHLAQILRRLNGLPEREWPASDAAWHTLIAQAVPAEAL